MLRKTLAAALLVAASIPAPAREPSPAPPPSRSAITVPVGGGVLSLRIVGDDVLHVHFLPHGTGTPPTLVMSPHAPRTASSPVTVAHEGRTRVLRNDRLRVVLDRGAGTLAVFEAGAHRPLLTERRLASLGRGTLALRFARGAALYGIDGFSIFHKPTAGMLRRGIQVARAGQQGNAGAPLLWSTEGFALLLDSKGATFDLRSSSLEVSKLSRPDPDFYLIVGPPTAIFAAVADLSGHAPLFPKWSMGFINSQFGIDQRELLHIVRGYRARHIPLDAFSLDFDWKAWGRDDYGEFRWNRVKFPDGPSGKLGKELAALGVHLIGIMKPRIHVDTVEGRYASAHHLWLPGEKASLDYFSHKRVRDLDFDKAATRAWFFNPTLEHSFDTGIVGWWNDEADETGDDTQFLNMERSLYDGQRAHSKLRVFSLNRDFWLGAQRYAYGLWSGDIQTGFASMAAQRPRMLSAIDVGEMWWGMDGGGFHGHPSPQNYARWIEFDAFVPVFRVHGDHDERRQPWIYGPVAERAATRAIRLRYRLLPYIYSYAWHDHVTGVGLVRPLYFGWPHDPRVRNDRSAWLFGRWLLVAPVVRRDATRKRIYLPPGVWTRWSTGEIYLGGRTITVPVDEKTWSDIPLFVRQGALIPTQRVMEYVGERPVHTVRVDVFPSATRTHFDYYDDDGETYAYGHGDYFLQRLTVEAGSRAVELDTAARTGTYRPALTHYLFAVHRVLARRVTLDGGALREAADLEALRNCRTACWAVGGGRLGGETYIELPAGVSARVRLHEAAEPGH